MKYAQIQDQIVTNVSLLKPTDIEGWEEIPDDVFTGFTLGKNGSFTPPPLPPSPIPNTVSMAQARIALIMSNKFDDIEQGLNSLKEPQKTIALTAWEYSTSVSRDGALVKTLSKSFGFTDQQLDELFIAAAAIEL